MAMAEKKKDNRREEASDKSKSQEQFSGLYRSETNKVIAGVAGGLGEYFNIDPTIIRVLFVLLTVFGGSGLVIYIVLWLIIPSRTAESKDSRNAIRDNLQDMKTRTQSFAHSITAGTEDKDNSRFWWAILIIILGFFFLLNNYGLLEPLDLERLWPVVLIIFGLAILLKKSK